MLIQLNDGQVLAVDFKYSVEGDRKPNGHKNRNAGRRSIECRVRLKFFVDRWYDSKNKVHDTKISFFAPVAEGKSTCCLEDKFNKQVGRAIAFSRAIEKSFHQCIKDNFEEIIDKYCKAEGIGEITKAITTTAVKIEEAPKRPIAPIIVPKATLEKLGNQVIGTFSVPKGLIDTHDEPPSTKIAPKQLGDIKLKISVVE